MMAVVYAGTGGAVVPGWCVAKGGVSSPKVLTCGRRGKSPRLNLAKGAMDRGDWPVGQQGHRGTCNAFAVTAAEELWALCAGEPLVKLSEEFLYKVMGAEPLPVSVDPQIAPSIDQSGTTFLLQAKTAIAKGALFPVALAPYDLRRGLAVNHVTDVPVPASGALHRDAKFLHDIAKSASIDAGVEWTGGDWGQDTVVELFESKLRAGVPVVASFALLEKVGMDAFTSPNGRFTGEARFPAPGLAAQFPPRAGHTVCLVGIEPGPGSDRLEDARFLFRNSHGGVRFGSLAGRGVDERTAPARGYGYVSARDVQRYCWEFLCRA